MATSVYISFTAAITRSREKPRMATIRASELLDQVLDAPAQLVGGGLLAGRAQRFLQLQLELGAAEAAAAVFEVPAHRRRGLGVELAVEVLEQAPQHLLAVHPVRVLAHALTFASCAKPSSPASRAWRQSCRCSLARARARRERTVPTGTPRISAASP